MYNIAGLVIILIVLIGVAAGHYPVLRMNRATIALVGAALLIVSGFISLEEAYSSIDMNTLVLLFSVMIININLSYAGFFRLIGSKVIYMAKTPGQLLALLIITSGFLSALFLNDTIVLMLTPLVIDITVSLKRNPIPYLIALATSANIGSTATITGNPQNMIIGIASGISFVKFAASLFPVAFFGLFFVWIIIVFLYREEFSGRFLQEKTLIKVKIYRPLFIKSVISAILMVIAFVAGFSIPLAALFSASVLLITRRLKPEKVFREIDWTLLVFFSALFIVTGSLETSGYSKKFFLLAEPFIKGNIISFTAVSVILSNLISNVPAVMLFRPVIPYLPDPEKAWLLLAMATTLAGNLTLIGSVANLIVAETAKKKHINLSFTEYLKVGVPVTILSLIAGVIWMALT